MPFLQIWVVFGAANQLMASLALLLVTLWLMSKGKSLPVDVHPLHLHVRHHHRGAALQGLRGVLHQPARAAKTIASVVCSANVIIGAVDLVLVVAALFLAWDALKAFQRYRAEERPRPRPRRKLICASAGVLSATHCFAKCVALSVGVDDMQPVPVEVIAPLPEGWGICLSCEMLMARANLDQAPAERGLDEYPPEWQEDFHRLSDLIFDLAARYGNSVLIRIWDPRSLQGMCEIHPLRRAALPDVRRGRAQDRVGGIRPAWSRPWRRRWCPRKGEMDQP